MTTTAPPAVPPVLRRAALGTAAVFALSGGMAATWIARLPTVRDRLETDTAALGFALLFMGIGSLLVMPFTGPLCARYGSRRVVTLTALPATVLLAGLGQVPDVVALGALLLALGACYGAWDVAMNIQASHVERAAGRPWMPRFHAMWSVGTITGAGLGALAAWSGVSVPAHFAMAAALIAVGVVLALRTFVDERDVTSGAEDKPGRLVNRRLVLIGTITLCSTTIEGAAADWLGLHITDDLAGSAALAAVGYAVFATAMTAARFAGPPVLDRLGRVSALRLGGMTTGVGIVLAALAPTIAVALLGGILWGLGVALIFPATMSAGGETPGRSAAGIATVATIGYGGFLIGPPLLGVLGHQIGLDRALLILVVLAAGIAVLAPAARPLTPAPSHGSPNPS
jgi:MFS family permease